MQNVGLIDSKEAATLLTLPWSVIHVPRQKDILRIGASPEYLYFIEDGWAARYSIRRDGSRRITGFMLPGDSCSIHAIAREPLDHAIMAVTDCEVARIPVDLVIAAAAESPAFSVALWRSKLIDEATLRVWLTNSKDALWSVAHLICELHARLDAIGEVSDGAFVLPATQEQIGDALNLTPVHVNRMLKKLRSAGLIQVRDFKAFIPDLQALQTACAFSPSYLHLGVSTPSRH
ncbi:Crp/Fnr family transcriptional regulator [Sphingomonas sp. XXL09]|uniref:Crp/Fnr family transcriptional regulator n=1 Tax=Sphingomonas sp. XXL09 TaxID=3457787 RepID=UPI00406BD5C9